MLIFCLEELKKRAVSKLNTKIYKGKERKERGKKENRLNL
jgi:hypothetical protein